MKENEAKVMHGGISNSSNLDNGGLLLFVSTHIFVSIDQDESSLSVKD